jgi:spore germination protein
MLLSICSIVEAINFFIIFSQAGIAGHLFVLFYSLLTYYIYKTLIGSQTMLLYIVKKDDTIDSIAAQYGLSPSSIAYDNQIPYPYRLAVGEALLLSVDDAIPSARPSIYSGGYAYPFISRWVLTQTLPYLSDLYIFSYGFTEEGLLVPPKADDTWILSLAISYQTSPILTLTPFGPDGRFSNYLISKLIHNPLAMETLKNELLSQMRDRGFQGVDIDFEYILAEDKDAFVEFVRYLKEAFLPFGYPLSVALAPKTSEEQKGLLYEGKDYKRLGKIADYVLLMTYEWGYTYGPPMAVAPLNKVREVINYALTVISPDKIHLGIPNYGYDWPLPFIRGESKAKTIGNVEAVQIAIENHASIEFDSLAQAPYFHYEKEGVLHEVWFEDVRSIKAKFDLIKEFSLRGCSYWNIMQLFRSNWLLLQHEFELQDH